MANVNKTHPEYDEMLPVWERCEDVANGTRKLWEKEEMYLPRLTDEEKDEYRARLRRTVLYNATWRTIVGYLGLLFRKPAIITMPESVRWMADDITLTGVPLRVFALELSEECMTTGRVGIWVNHPVVEAGTTQADAEVLNIRPSMQLFDAKGIYNWRRERINNKMTLSQVRLREKKLVIENEFSSKGEDRFRVLDLTLDGPTGPRPPGGHIYRVRVFAINDRDEDVLVEGPFYPLMNGEFMNYVPFFPVSPDDTTIDVDEPPLVDLVDTNIAHFQVTADYENGCHWSGIPTLTITGHALDKGDKIKVGAGEAIVLPQPTAKVSIVEVGTGGFAALEKNLDRKEAQMVVLGARLLEVQKPGIEAAETALIHRAGEQSVLSNMAQTISAGITAALDTFVKWAGGEGPTGFELNRDFFHTPLSPEMMKAIVAAWQDKAISAETRFELLKRGEVYAPDAKFDDEEKLILEGSPNERIPETTQL